MAPPLVLDLQNAHHIRSSCEPIDRDFEPVSQYEISGIKALSLVQSNQSWIRGEVVYAEAHCYSPALKRWLDCVMAPLPGEHAALIEAARSSQGENGGFWVSFVNDGDVSGSGPQLIH